MPAHPVIHPSAESLRAFGLGKMDATSAGVLIDHLDQCQECSKAVAALSGDGFLERIRQAHDQDATPTPVKPLSPILRDSKPAIPAPLPDLPPELAGHPQYEILRELGRGGMGVVYLAKNKLMDRLEVLKVVNKALLDRPSAVERFLREIRSAAKLSHANVVGAYSALQVGNLLAFAMEYVEGEDLAVVVDKHGPLPVVQACYYVQQAALGLQHACEKGMVHRDIKPQNLILARVGKAHVVKILDFGLAKVVREKAENTGLTGEGKMMGTPDYMAPEQTRDAASADIRADIYSLGCTLYYLLNGKPPFEGGNLYAVIYAHQSLEATPLNQARPEVPEALAAVVRKMMAKEPDQRYQKPMEVAQVLSAFIKRGGKDLPPKRSPDLPVASPRKASATVAASAAASASLTEDRTASAEPRQAVPQATTTARSPFDDLDATPTVASASKKAKKRRTVAVSLALALLVPLVGWLAVTILRVETPNGTLIVEMNDGEVETRIKNGKLILSGLDGKDRYTLTPSDRSKKLAAGPYKIRVEGADGLVLDTPEFTIEKGGQVKVRVTIGPKPIPDAAQKAPAIVPADALRRADIPEAVLASLGGGDPKRAPAELVAVLGDGRFRLTNNYSRFPAFSSDGTLLALPSGVEAFLFDANSGQLLRRFRSRTGRVCSVAFSPNGKVFAMGDEYTVRLWDPRTGVLLQDLSGHTHGMIKGVAFSPDSQTVVSCSDDDKAVRVWDVKTGRQTHVHSCKEAVISVAVAPDGRLAVAGISDGSVHGWSLDTGAEQFVVPHGQGGGQGGAFVSVSAEGQWLASGTNDKLKVWKIADLAKKDPVPFFEKQTPAGWLQFEKHSNKLWTGEHNSPTTGNRVCCWDLASAQLVSSFTLRSTDSPWWSYALAPDDRTLAAFGCEGDRVVQLYDTLTGKPRFADPGHTREVRTVAFSPDGRWLASGSEDNTVRVWDLATGTQRHKLEGHTALVGSVAFSPDGKLLASGSNDGTIALWDPVVGARVRTLNGHASWTRVRFSPDSKLVAAGTADGGVQMWYARNGEEARMLRGLHQGPVWCLDFSADGQRLATGGNDGKLVITDPASGKVLQSFQRNTAITTVVFGGDGETVVAGYNHPESVGRVWNLKDKDFVVLQGHTDHVNSVSLRSDGRLAVTASSDGSVRVWEIGGNLPRKMVLGTGTVGERLWIGALSPDGRYVATGNTNGTIYLFRLPATTENVGEWLAARGTPPRGLSDEAWNERVKGLYVGNVPDAVRERLRELNPGFDRPLSPVIEGGVVTELRFGCPNVKDVSPLRALPGLRTLVCVEGPLTDLSPLKDMKLTDFRCGTTQVSDLSPLKGMPLSFLDCGRTRVSDLTPLKDMKLTVLYCNDTPVSDLTPLKDMKLTELYLAGNRSFSDLAPLKDMKLTKLDCKATSVSDLTPLKDMKLTVLYCHESQVTGTALAPLQEMSSLRWLEIGGPKMTDAGLEHLKKLTNLEVLCLYNSKLTGAGLIHLNGMTRLAILRLDNTGLTDEGLFHLKGLLGLRELLLHQTRVTNAGLEHLSSLKNLGRLTLEGTAVTAKGVAKLKAALPKCNITR